LAATPAIPRWAGVVLLMVIATVFGSNHVAARVAFEHGANVTTAVAFRSAGTSLFVLGLLLFSGVSLRMEKKTLRQVLVIGLCLSVQSYCLYSAVALIPVALALLAFQTFPMWLALITWLADGTRPARRVLLAMPVALVGLAFALGVVGGPGFAAQWRELGAGVLWATGAAISFATVLYLTGRWLRSFGIMTVVAVVVTAGGAVAGDFQLPVDGTGWFAVAALTALYGTAITSLFVVLPKLGAVNNAVILNFEPIAVLLIAFLVLGQTVAPLQVLGAFIVVGAIVMAGGK
jgi:drug/metabolite transporter (DMT)-like permease